ncbi:MAG: hypothetical protein DYG93_11170 [Leptolyngbya sp. PLA2]|nr:hypothetical protein [Leptolyngbya sp.]MCE7972204.1 hypothetical protein [Leptolyngbya sp. PL-A2]MCQ3941218.1 hypothetical protein [cyanobacterium CYA1]MDL1905503.1 hypothetical protein [Synechococcales cyanobacterium CNB]
MAKWYYCTVSDRNTKKRCGVYYVKAGSKPHAVRIARSVGATLSGISMFAAAASAKRVIDPSHLEHAAQYGNLSAAVFCNTEVAA